MAIVRGHGETVFTDLDAQVFTSTGMTHDGDQAIESYAETCPNCTNDFTEKREPGSTHIELGFLFSLIDLDEAYDHARRIRKDFSPNKDDS